MSMLSAQMDKLRELATRYDELQVGAVKAVTMPSNMGSILRDAADTIWQLRDDLQRANDAVRDAEHEESRAWDRVRKAEAEADKLREERDGWKKVCVDQEVMHAMHEDALDNEIAKLRELAHDLWKACPADGYYCIHHCEHYDKESESHCKLEDRMRELEVDA